MKTKKILLMTIVMICMFANTVFASTTTISLIGDENANTNEEKTIVVKFTSDEDIGLISGKIAVNANIKSITVSGKNNWNLTYNPENGLFNIYNTKGAKEAEIMEIKYVASETEGTGEIVLNDLKTTTISYVTENIASASKNITIKTEAVTPDTPSNPETPSDSDKPSTPTDSDKPINTDKPSTPVDSEKPSNTDKPSVPSNSDKPNTPSSSTTTDEPKTVVRIEGTNTSKKDTTISTSKLPATGEEIKTSINYIVIGIAVCLAVAVISVVKYIILKGDIKNGKR